MNQNLQKILDHISKLTFLTLNKTGFNYGPPGKLLHRNIENHWFQQCITKPSYNVFLTASDQFVDVIKHVKSYGVDFLPFGLGMLQQSKSKLNHWILDYYENSQLIHKTAKVIIFIDASEAKDIFHIKQRERKIWWRKLACNPSSFNLTEVKKSKNYDLVDIQAQFPFGNITIETIKCYHDIQKFIPQNLVKELDLSEVQAVEHTASLDWGCMTLLCDGYKEFDESINLHIHPRISPYKVTFSALTTDSDSELIQKDLKDLIYYLNNLLRMSGITTILTNNKLNNVQLQVPFIVNVNNTSLKNGIIQVKSQFTTLSESVHITGLIEHISSRCL